MDQVSWTSELTAWALASTSGRNMGWSIVPIHGNANYLLLFNQASTQTWVLSFTWGHKPLRVPFSCLLKSGRPASPYNKVAWNERDCSLWSGSVLSCVCLSRCCRLVWKKPAPTFVHHMKVTRARQKDWAGDSFELIPILLLLCVVCWWSHEESKSRCIVPQCVTRF